MAELSALLQNFCRIDGVLGALVLDAQGRIAAENEGDGAEGESTIGALRELLPQVKGLLDSLESFHIERQHVFLGERQFIVESLAKGAALVVWATSECSNLGRIRLEIRKAKPNIEAALG